MQRTLSELLHLGVDLRDYYAPHVDKAMVLCVGHKVKDFVQHLARLFESGKDSLLDVKAMDKYNDAPVVQAAPPPLCTPAQPRFCSQHSHPSSRPSRSCHRSS